MTATQVLVPVKALGLAKSRLSDVLTARERAELVLAMMRDTVSAAMAAGDVAVTVITGDERVAGAARACGAEVFPDPVAPGSPDPLNSALRAAARRVRESVPDAELVALQADLPALRPEEFARAREVARGSGSAVVTDHTAGGTTALFHCVPGSMPPLHFGPDSARLHVAAGAVAVPDAVPGLRLDVDTIADLVAAARLGVGEATAAVSDELGFTVSRPARQNVVS
ncbi:2-phospho-L-lactate guanylyltransferase [Rhodococcus sp. Z13]|uniref:2-phospho-L-lactate guanylyltransferase n=1 Tax=Rhodococcus sacchari TaxID=2962047 RepID=A0ACD4DC98_9NOCA|nr:2-phospho-L-lactate guanylyltransferase [Rhodococcus sp. Z13]UYP17611.1 2-phospho-L-lactate guanylyltransferase [Rhodococcus sp. Z13]